jgi:uncharacterized protein (DUF58 family)
VNSIKNYFREKFELWLARRVPKNDHHQLNSGNIMIYPTRFGLSYLSFIILVFLLGTNYQNNIILLFSYLLASLFISVMLHSFYNFTKLRFQSVSKQQGYAGDTLYFPISIMADKTHFDINIHFTNKELNSPSVTILQCVNKNQTYKLAFNPIKRGVQLLGRVTVFSEYSLGLFKSKAVLDFGHHAIIFPKPKSLITNKYQSANKDSEPNQDSYQTTTITGTDDFSELRHFVKGESKARTAWKQLAKGQGHYSKHYQTSEGQLQWLKLNEMPGHDIETRLAYLSFLVGEMTFSNQTFGLSLESGFSNKLLNIEPNSGLAHQQACLTALAMY